jgi:hypothetical protein
MPFLKARMPLKLFDYRLHTCLEKHVYQRLTTDRADELADLSLDELTSDEDGEDNKESQTTTTQSQHDPIDIDEPSDWEALQCDDEPLPPAHELLRPRTRQQVRVSSLTSVATTGGNSSSQTASSVRASSLTASPLAHCETDLQPGAPGSRRQPFVLPDSPSPMHEPLSFVWPRPADLLCWKYSIADVNWENLLGHLHVAADDLPGLIFELEKIIDEAVAKDDLEPFLAGSWNRDFRL